MSDGSWPDAVVKRLRALDGTTVRLSRCKDATRVWQVSLNRRSVPALWVLYLTRWLLNARVFAFLDHLTAAFPQGSADELAAYVEG